MHGTARTIQANKDILTQRLKRFAFLDEVFFKDRVRMPSVTQIMIIKICKERIRILIPIVIAIAITLIIIAAAKIKTIKPFFVASYSKSHDRIFIIFSRFDHYISSRKMIHGTKQFVLMICL